MKPTLFSLSDDMNALDEILAETGGDLSDPRSEEILESWEAELESNLSAKVDGYCRFIAELEARASTRSNEAARLAARAKVDESTASRLRERLRAVWETRSLPAIETANYRVSLAKNGGKNPLDLHGDVPPEFTKTKTIIEPDREKIRAALEAGERLTFALLMERGSRIAIR